MFGVRHNENSFLVSMFEKCFRVVARNQEQGNMETQKLKNNLKHVRQN